MFQSLSLVNSSYFRTFAEAWVKHTLLAISFLFRWFWKVCIFISLVREAMVRVKIIFFYWNSIWQANEQNDSQNTQLWCEYENNNAHKSQSWMTCWIVFKVFALEINRYHSLFFKVNEQINALPMNVLENDDSKKVLLRSFCQDWILHLFLLLSNFWSYFTAEWLPKLEQNNYLNRKCHHIAVTHHTVKINQLKIIVTSTSRQLSALRHNKLNFIRLQKITHHVILIAGLEFLVF